MLQGMAPFALIVLVAAVAAGGLVGARPRADDATLADFDHATHLARGLECADCHTGLEEGSTSARAGVASLANCAELCHGDFDEEARERMGRTPNGLLVLAHLAAGTEPPWPRAAWVPEHVVFSHRRHVAIAGIPCERCHGDVASSHTLPLRPPSGTLDMEGCMSCHEQHGASNDCFACHR